jgi:hypothetical protein
MRQPQEDCALHAKRLPLVVRSGSPELLPQPSGFEGFLLRLVERERCLLAVPNRHQPRASSLNFDAIASSHVRDVLGDQEAVSDLYRAIDDLDSNFVPRREKPSINAWISPWPR